MTRAQWLAAYRDMRIRNGNWGLITWQRFRLNDLIWQHDFFAIGTEPRRIRFRLACRVSQDRFFPGLRLYKLRRRLALYRLLQHWRVPA